MARNITEKWLYVPQNMDKLHQTDVFTVNLYMKWHPISHFGWHTIFFSCTFWVVTFEIKSNNGAVQSVLFIEKPLKLSTAPSSQAPLLIFIDPPGKEIGMDSF